MAVLGHTDLKKGVMVELDGAPHQVVESSHMATGRGGAVMRTKLKNLVTGAIFDKAFRASDKLTSADVTKVNMQYLYADADSYYFMNQDTFEQTELGRQLVGESGSYLKEGAKAIVMYFGERPIGVDIGNNVFLQVTSTEPGVRGDTATSALKPATLETGRELMVPLFINEGDVIKVDTRDGRYLERQK
jgi:elongation factor P